MSRYRRSPRVVDDLTVGDAGLVLVEQTLVCLGPVGLLVWQALTEPRELTEIADHVEAAIGQPPQGSTADALVGVLADLANQGVVEEVTDGQ